VAPTHLAVQVHERRDLGHVIGLEGALLLALQVNEVARQLALLLDVEQDHLLNLHSAGTNTCLKWALGFNRCHS
jgi:hypothetical protein